MVPTILPVPIRRKYWARKCQLGKSEPQSRPAIYATHYFSYVSSMLTGFIAVESDSRTSKAVGLDSNFEISIGAPQELSSPTTSVGDAKREKSKTLKLRAPRCANYSVRNSKTVAVIVSCAASVIR